MAATKEKKKRGRSNKKEQKVIWILTASQQVILAETEKDWLICDWDKPFDIVDEHSVNLGEMLKARGVK